MARMVRKVPMMWYKKGAQALGRIGACLVFVSSVLVFAGPTSASAAALTAHEYEYGHDQFSVYLTGDRFRDGGDPNGQGFARLDFDLDNERVCYVVRWRRLEGDVTAFQLRFSSHGDYDGPVMINFFSHERYNGDGDTVVDCVPIDRGRIRAVLGDPSAYSLTLRTTVYDDAIRGRLN